jgi:hypothetical protein
MAKIDRACKLREDDTLVLAATYRVEMFGNLLDTIMALVNNDGSFEDRYYAILVTLDLNRTSVEAATQAFTAASISPKMKYEAVKIARKHKLKCDLRPTTAKAATAYQQRKWKDQRLKITAADRREDDRDESDAVRLCSSTDAADGSDGAD